MLNLVEYSDAGFIRDVFNSLGIRGYLVGGAVRDMLLGRKPVDFDFVVELDEYKHKIFSDRIAALLGCRYTYNDHYHTAKFLVKGLDIDFIMARDEIYDDVAARPRVWSSNLDRDLLRRDFTINSMARPLWVEEKLIDPLGGREDLERGIIRIIHSRSFYDDPTRIFRAFKYAARFGFALDDLTEGCLFDSLRNGVLNYLPGERLKNELTSVLLEGNIKYLVDMLEKYYIMKYIAGCDVIINNIALGKLGGKNLFAVLFFRNDEEVLRRIEMRLNLGKSFIELCSKLKSLEKLEGEEEAFYSFLINNKGLLSENILTELFSKDTKVGNYLKFKDKLKLEDEEIIKTRQKGIGLNTAKVKKLMMLIRSEK